MLNIFQLPGEDDQDYFQIKKYTSPKVLIKSNRSRN